MISNLSLKISLLIKKNFIPFFLISFLILTSCGGFSKPGNVNTPVEGRERARKNLEEGRGVSPFKGGFGRSTNYEFSTSNPMWRATFDVIDFMPLITVDYSGGMIITDWYTDTNTSNDSLKFTIRFLSNEIRADSLKIIVHKKKCSLQQECSVKKISSTLSNELRAAILKKAIIYQKIDKAKKPKKKVGEIWTDKPD